MFFNPDRAKLLLLEFDLAGLKLSDLQLRQFLRLDQLLLNYLDQLDLTRTSPRQLILKHYLDSALVAQFLPEPTGALLDLGSGAGFPGLPLAILNPHWPLILAEPRQKRLAFLEEVIALLGLPRVRVYPHKVGPRLAEPLEAIICRDFGPLTEILELAAPILPENGQIYLLKGARVEEEIQEAQKTPAWAHFTQLTLRRYQVGPQERSLVTLRKKTPRPPQAQPPGRSLEIASRQNPRFRSWLKLLAGRQQRRLGETLAAGPKIVRDLLTNQADLILGLLATKPRDLDGYPVKSSTPVFFLRPEIFPELDPLGVGPPLAWLKTPALPTWEPGEAWPVPWLLIPFQDPRNVGTVIRAAAALAAPVVLLAEAASPFHYKALRAAGPTVFQTPLLLGPSYRELPDLPRDDLYALSPRGQSIWRHSGPPGLGLALGPEGPGLDSLWAPERRLTIPMKPGVESLNAALAAAMALAILAARREKN
jgi:16S rRNA (guanine527-N7)-methyltransferase